MNLVVAAIMVLGGIAQFFPIGWQEAIVGSYVIIFGLGELCSFQPWGVSVAVVVHC